MKRSGIWRQFAFCCIFLAPLAGLAACSGSDKKDDTKVVEQREPTRGEKLGISDDALDRFETAAKELEQPKPDTQKALDLLKGAVAKAPDFAEAQYNLGLLYLQLGQLEDAVAALEKTRELEPGVAEYSVALGRAYSGLARYDDAKVLFDEVLARDTNNLTAKNNLAVLELIRGNTDLAISALQEILREDQKNISALNTMGRVYHRAGNLSLAKYVFEEKGLKVDPKNPDLHNNLGLVYLDLNQVPEAVDHFQQAVDSDPNYYEGHINLGTIVLEYLDYKRAEGEFMEAVRVVPANCDARLGLAASKFAVGAHQESADGYVYYLANCDRNHVSSHARLAKLYQTYLNQPDKALDEYRILTGIAKTDKEKKTYEAMVGFLENQQKQGSQKAPAAPADDQPTEQDAGSEDGAAETEGAEGGAAETAGE